ncbi:MAG: hypothetical protein ACHQUC_02315 [Chlamydiales bacterium]
MASSSLSLNQVIGIGTPSTTPPIAQSECVFPTVEQWWEKYRSDFVSHAVWGVNMAKVLEDRKLNAAEQVLRETKSVEYEEGYGFGGRKTRELPQLTPEQIQALNAIFEEGLKSGFAESTLESERMVINGAAILEKPSGSFDIITQFALVNVSIVRKFEEKLNETAHFHSTTASIVAVAYDMSRPPEKRVDRMISEIYEKYLGRMKLMPTCSEFYGAVHEIRSSIFSEITSEMHQLSSVESGISDLEKADKMKDLSKRLVSTEIEVKERIKQKFGIEKMLGLSKAELIQYCNQLRDATFPITKLNAEIRTYKGKIAWRYGDLVVLRGNTQDIIGLDDCKGETFLLRPWQNNGDFFALQLDDPAVLILAPKRIIEEHQRTGGAKYSNLHAIEDLSPEMLETFSVPKELHFAS